MWDIACSSTTLSELVVPILDRDGSVRAVLDLDAEAVAYFSGADAKAMESLMQWLGGRYFP